MWRVFQWSRSVPTVWCGGCFSGPGVSLQFGVEDVSVVQVCPQSGVGCFSGPRVSLECGLRVFQWSRCVPRVWCGDVSVVQGCPYSLVWGCFSGSVVSLQFGVEGVSVV